MNKNVLPLPYIVFAPVVADIKAGTSTARYLGAGSESRVWQVTQDGAGYAVKIANAVSLRGRPRNTYAATAQKISVGLRGLGIAGLEQLQTGSPEDGAVVYDFVCGVRVSEMTDAIAQLVTPRHLEGLWKTVAAATVAGIEFDGWNDKGENAFFCPRRGFTLIDYQAAENITFEQNMKFVTRSLGHLGTRLCGELQRPADL